MTILYCDECGSRLIEDGGRYVCPNCGLEQGAVYEATSYCAGLKNNLNYKAQQFVAIGNRLATVSDLGSSIGRINENYLKDAKGALLSPSKQRTFRKFKNYYHISSAVKGKENDHRVLTIMNKVCGILNIPEVVNERAVYLYKKYKKQYGDKITNHVILSTLALVIGVRESRSSCPVQFKEIVETYKTLGHAVSGKKVISTMQDLNIKISVSGIRRSEEYLSRVCSLVCNDKEIKARIEKKYSIDAYVYEKILELVSYRILSKISLKSRGGRRPYPFACSAVYVADKLFAKMLNSSSALTQKLVSKAASVAEYTVREQSEIIMRANLENIFTDISEKLNLAIEGKKYK